MVWQITAQEYIARCLAVLRAFNLRLLALIIISFIAVSCANLPEPIPESVSDQLQHYPSSVQHCAFQLVDFKRTVQQQGVQDVQHLWVPRYPHLAFDRFSLSLIPELTSQQSKEQWLHYVARLASVQRKVEYQNLAIKPVLILKTTRNAHSNSPTPRSVSVSSGTVAPISASYSV